MVSDSVSDANNAELPELSSSQNETSAGTPVCSAAVPKASTKRFKVVGAILAALMAAVTALPAVIALDGAFPVENLSVEMTNRIRNRRDDPIAWAKERSNRWTSLYQTTGTCLAAFGACAGLMLGLVVGLETSSISSAIRLILWGAIVGGVSGGVGGVLEAALLMKLENTGLDITLKTILGHAVGWSVLAAGLLMIPRSIPGRRDRFLPALGRGLSAAIAAALIYSPVAAIVFQLERSDKSIPEGTLNKLMFLSLGALCVIYSIAIPRIAGTVPLGECAPTDQPELSKSALTVSH